MTVGIIIVNDAQSIVRTMDNVYFVTLAV